MTDRRAEIAERLDARIRNVKKGGGGHTNYDTIDLCRDALAELTRLTAEAEAQRDRFAEREAIYKDQIATGGRVIDELRAEVATLTADLERMREAAKPFGAAWDKAWSECGGHQGMPDAQPWNHVFWHHFKAVADAIAAFEAASQGSKS